MRPPWSVSWRRGWMTPALRQRITDDQEELRYRLRGVFQAWRWGSDRCCWCWMTLSKT
jgi:hypothetical protein